MHEDYTVRVRTIKNTSALIYIIVCMSMVYIEFAYRHAILTLLPLWIILFPLMVLLSRLIKKESSNNPAKPAKWYDTLIVVVICVTSTVLACILFSNNYFRNKQSHDMWTFQATALMLLGVPGIIFINKKHREKNRLHEVLNLIYVLVVLATVAYMLFASPCTVRCAKKIVTDAGYENVIYVSHHDELDVLPLIIKTSDTSNLGRHRFVDYYPELGEYLFVADKSGEEYAVLVHVGRAEIDATCIIYEGGLLGDIIENVKNMPYWAKHSIFRNENYSEYITGPE